MGPLSAETFVAAASMDWSRGGEVVERLADAVRVEPRVGKHLRHDVNEIVMSPQ